jgi:hypothetical protein
VILELVIVLLLAQAPPRDAPPPRVDGTAVVRGRVLDKESGQPIPGARLTLMALLPGAMEARTTTQAETDRDGRYEFAGIAPGEYLLKGTAGEMRATHLWQWLGSKEPEILAGQPIPRPFVLAAGDVRDSADLHLIRALAIEGSVVNDAGDPMAAIEVQARRIGGGDSGEARVTDDRGFFRIFRLAPGEYRVCARPPSAAPAADGSSTTRYTRSCYPSALDDAAAAPVVLKSTDATGITVRLLRTGVHTVAGTVVDSAGNPAHNSHIELRRKVGDGTIVSTAVRVRGNEFTAHGVESGHYFLIATSDGSSSNGRTTVRERLVMPMSVESDMTGLFVSTRPGTDVKGRVVFDAQPPRGRISVVSHRDDDIGRLFSETASAAVENDGSFVLRSMFGPQVVRVVGLPAGWFVSSVRYGERDITDVPMTFMTSAGSPEVEIVISNHGARLSAIVKDAEAAAYICHILVFPVEAVRWSTLAASFSGFARDSVCEVGVVRPGEYFVLAATPADMASRYAEGGTDINTTVLARGARVVLKAGDTKTVALSYAGAPRDR